MGKTKAGGTGHASALERRMSTKFNGVSYIVQRGAEALYSPEGKAQVKALIEHYMGNAACSSKGCKKAGLQVFGGVNAPYIWVGCPNGVTSWQMFDKMLNDANVVITPGSGFGGEKATSASAPSTAARTPKEVAAACRKELVRRVMSDLLAPFREVDAQESMRLATQTGFDDLRLAFFKQQDLGDDGVWDVWQLEGPHMVWYFRGAPHVHCWGPHPGSARRRRLSVHLFRQAKISSSSEHARHGTFPVTGPGFEALFRPVTPEQAREILEGVRAGSTSVAKALDSFRAAPVEHLPFAAIDTHRTLRKGFPEVIFGAGKTPEQTVAIARRILAQDKQLLVTRITPDHARRLRRAFKKAVYHHERPVRHRRESSASQTRRLPRRRRRRHQRPARRRRGRRHRRSHGQPRAAHL
jgi:hypothetical protein